MFVCNFCSKVCKNKKSLIAHEATCPSNPEGYRNVPWNKGKTKENDDRLESFSKRTTGKKRNPHSEETKQKIALKSLGRKHSEESKRKMIGSGGYRKGGGRGKKGWYEGFFCDSSWELAFVIYCLDHNIEVIRNTEKRQYIFEGKVKNYIPDFYVNGILTEIKGYRTKEWEAKLEANTDVVVLYQKEIKPYLDYAIGKFGKDFIKVYNSEGIRLDEEPVLKTGSTV